MIQKISAFALVLAAVAMIANAKPLSDIVANTERANFGGSSTGQNKITKASMDSSAPAPAKSNDSSVGKTTEKNISKNEDISLVFLDEKLDDQGYSLAVSNCVADSSTVRDIQSLMTKGTITPYVANVPKVKTITKPDAGGRCVTCYQVSVGDKNMLIGAVNSFGDDGVFVVGAKAFDELNGGSKVRPFAIEAVVNPINNSKCGV